MLGILTDRTYRHLFLAQLVALIGTGLLTVALGLLAFELAGNEAGQVLGYGYYAPFRDRSAYRFTAEESIYVRDDIRGQGVGKALVAALLDHAEARGFRQMIAVIGDSENIGSIGLHISLGFRKIGVLKAVGVKFGRWIDVVQMQKALGEGERSLP